MQDILLITEIKVGNSFPEVPLVVDGDSILLRLDRNTYISGSLLQFPNHINATELKMYVFKIEIDTI